MGAGCNDNNEFIAPRNQPGQTPITASGWEQVSESIRCEAVTPASCQGFYGLAVKADGSYQVGPSPDGQFLSGNLTGSEFTQFATNANAVAAQSHVANCTQGSGIPGMDDKVTLKLSAASTINIYDKNIASYCYDANQALAEKLQGDIHSLTQKYYITPFPSATITPVRNGLWGGMEIELKVSGSQSTYRLDCAHGVIDGPIVTDTDGNFMTTGSITREGGPVPQGGFHPQPATYSGTVQGSNQGSNQGSKMMLTITFTPEGSPSPSTTNFNLNYGENGKFTQVCALVQSPTP